MNLDWRAWGVTTRREFNERLFQLSREDRARVLDDFNGAVIAQLRAVLT